MPDRRCECVAQFGLFEVAQYVKRMAVHQGKDRMAGGSVITDAGGKVGHPAIHRRFDNRLAELPLRMFQRRFGYADPALAAARVVVAVFRAVLTFSRSSAEMAFCDRLRRRRASLAALLCSACAFATSAWAFASCAWAFSTAMR